MRSPDNEFLDFERQEETERLETAVRRRLNGRLRSFRLLIHAGGLTLYGEVSSFHAKQLAQHAIMEMTDCPILANEIAVRTCAPDPQEVVQG